MATFSLLIHVELHFARELRGGAVGVHDGVVAGEEIVLWEWHERVRTAALGVALLVRPHCIWLLL